MENGSSPEKKYQPLSTRDVDSLTTIMIGTQDPDMLGRIVATLDEILKLDPLNPEALAIIDITTAKFSIYSDSESADIEKIRQLSLEEAELIDYLAQSRERAKFDALVRLYHDEPAMTDFERNTNTPRNPSEQE